MRPAEASEEKEKKVEEVEKTPADEEYDALDEDLKATSMTRDSKMLFQKSLGGWDDKFNNILNSKNTELDDKIPAKFKK